MERGSERLYMIIHIHREKMEKLIKLIALVIVAVLGSGCQSLPDPEKNSGGSEQGGYDTDKVTDILSRITSITYMQTGTGGEATMWYEEDDFIIPGTASLNFEITPVSIASELVGIYETALEVQALDWSQGSALNIIRLPIETISADSGVLSVTVSGENLREEYFNAEEPINVRLYITDGERGITSDKFEMIPKLSKGVSFKDKNLEEYCIKNYDSDNDGLLSKKELQAVTSLGLQSGDFIIIYSSDMAKFSNLGSLYISNYTSTDEELDLTGNSRLWRIFITGEVKQLNVSGLTNLEYLYCDNCGLRTLTVTGCTRLRELKCSNNPSLNYLNLDNCESLKYFNESSTDPGHISINKIGAKKLRISCDNTSLTYFDYVITTTGRGTTSDEDCLESLEIDDSRTLTMIKIQSSNLKSLKLGRMTKLMVLDLDCESVYLGSLDLSGWAELESVCVHAGMDELNVSGCCNLSSLECSGSLMRLYASGCSALKYLHLGNCSNLWILDISDCTGLSSLNIDGCTSLYRVSACGLKCGTGVIVDGLAGIIYGYDDEMNVFPRVISSYTKYGTLNDCLEWLNGRWGLATSNDLINGMKYLKIAEGDRYWVSGVDGGNINRAGQTYESEWTESPSYLLASAKAVFSFQDAFQDH